MARRTQPVRKRDRQTVALYLRSLAKTRALEQRIAERAAELEKRLAGDATTLRDAMRRETNEFRLRRLEAAYLYCVHRLAMMRRAQKLAAHSIEQIDRLLPEGVTGNGRG